MAKGLHEPVVRSYLPYFFRQDGWDISKDTYLKTHSRHATNEKGFTIRPHHIAIVVIVALVVLTVVSAIVGISVYAFNYPDKPPGAVKNITAASVIITFENIFQELSPDAEYSVIVSTTDDDDDSQLSELLTWAAVQSLSPQPPYVAIYRCTDLFSTTTVNGVSGTCSQQGTGSGSRRKRQTSVSVDVHIGADTTCEISATEKYCNGPLKSNTKYYTKIIAHFGNLIKDIAVFLSFITEPEPETTTITILPTTIAIPKITLPTTAVTTTISLSTTKTLLKTAIQTTMNKPTTMLTTTTIPSTTIAETTTRTPTTPEHVETTTDASETSTEALETTTEAFQTTTEAPQTTSNTAETTTEVPKTTTESLESTTPFLTTTTQSSETTTATPKITTEFLETTTEIPQITTEYFETTTETPKITTESPETTTETPKTTTETPKTTTESPETTSKHAQSTTNSVQTTTEPYKTTTEAFLTTTEPLLTTTEPLLTTTDEPQTTTPDEITANLDSITATTAAITLNDPFQQFNLSDTAVYSIFVVPVNGGNLSSSFNDSYTWASVQDSDPQPPYVAEQCEGLFINGNCNLQPVDRRKRRALVYFQRIRMRLGSNKQCNRRSINVYCNGPLRESTQYSIVLIVRDGNRIFQSAFSKVFSTGRRGNWATWSDWGSCDVTCGGGVQRRERQCEDGTECDGRSGQSLRCNDNSCRRTGITGSWTLWSEWGSCDATCGGGLQRRERQCRNGTECPGRAMQSLSCNPDNCPSTVETGTWAAWTQWNGCTVTCGRGVRSRSRKCDEGPYNNLKCDGLGNDSEQSRCSEWLCPDCFYQCPQGSLHFDCTHCECPSSTTVRGKVWSSSGSALSGVTISLADRPYVTLYTTLPDGLFTLYAMCSDQRVVFAKYGYEPETLLGRSSQGNVTLFGGEPLVMDMDPQSKNRVVGDDVMFCCSANGNPLPDFYEWYKNDMLISGERGSTLSLSSVTTSSSGWYRCRANTASTALFSAEAKFTVKGSADDYCPQVAIPKQQKLPDGCVYNGNTFIDVGQCEKLSCHGKDTETETDDVGESCIDKNRFCCAASEYQDEDIDCGSFILKISTVVGCGCALCIDPVVEIEGAVYAGDTGYGLENADIWYNNTLVTATDEEGQFYFTVSQGVQRVAISARPSNISEYADGASVVVLGPEAEGVYYTTITLNKAQVLPPFSTSGDTLLPLNGLTQEVLSVEVPSNSVYDENGSLYNGMVTPVVSVIDPRDELALQAAPGDLVGNSGVGEEEQLQSYGMFQISLFGEQGTKLQMSENANIEIPETVLGTQDSQFNNIENIKLWSFDSSGRWTVVSDLKKLERRRRRKRNVVVLSASIRISVTQVWYNFDAVSRTTCYSKIRVYESDELDVYQQKLGASIAVYVAGSDGTHSLSRILARGNNDRNGYCVVHRCDSLRNGDTDVGFRGIITAEFEGKQLHPVNISTTNLGTLEQELDYMAYDFHMEVDLNLKAVPGKNGPFYDWEYPKWRYSYECVNAPTTDPHFQFYLQKQDQCFKHYEINAKYVPPRSSCNPVLYKSWPSIPEIRNSEYAACFIKIQLRYINRDIKVQAMSSVGGFDENGIDISGTQILPGDQYGFREDCNNNRFVCSEIKIPGPTGCNSNPDEDKDDAYTKVAVRAYFSDGSSYLDLDVIETNPYFQDEFDILRNDTTFTFHFTQPLNDFGVFCETGADTYKLAVDTAKKQCRNSDDDVFAVKFGTNSTGNLDIIILVDISSSNYAQIVRNSISDLISTYVIGPDATRVALITTYDRSCDGSLDASDTAATIEWNLSDSNTSSTIDLLYSVNNFYYPGGNCHFLPYTYEFLIGNVIAGQGDRPEVPNVVLSYGDGNHYRHSGGLYSKVQQIRDLSDRMIAVCSGPQCHQYYMNLIADSSEYVYPIDNFEDIRTAVDVIAYG